MTGCRLLLAALLLGTGVHSCSSPVDWVEKTLEERARQPRWVVYGTVLTDETPAPDDVGDQESVYTLKPECWLKHDSAVPKVTFANITVFERKWDCVAATLEKGSKYIIFLKYAYEKFIVDDVNVQSGVIDEPTDEDFGAVYRGIEAGMDGLPDGLCLEGVDIPYFVGNTVYKKVCDKCDGVVVKAAMLAVVMTSLVSTLMTF